MRRLWRFLLIAILALGVLIFPSSHAAAQTQPLSAQEQSDAYREVIPSFEGVSFRDLGRIEDSGEVSFQGDSRQWESGDYVSDVLTMGDVSSLNGQSLSLGQVSQLTGTDQSAGRLSDFDLLGQQSLSNLNQSVPYLGDYRVRDVEPVRQLLSEETGLSFSGEAVAGGGDESLPGQPQPGEGTTLDEVFSSTQFGDQDTPLGDRTISEILAADPALGELKLNNTDLSHFSIGQIPNVETVPFSDLEGWEEATLSEVPGLDSVALSDFPNGITGLDGIIARIDFNWSTAETDRTNTISGSYQAGFEVPCPAEGKLTKFDSPYEAENANDPPECSYIELDDLENVGRAQQGPFEGKQWISGKYHEVEGGFGPLKYVPSPLGYSVGYEPTGRHPFGDIFKVVVWEPYEVTDVTSFKIFFRWCTYIPFVGKTCTPYNQFSLPWFDYKVNSLVYVGPLDGEGGASAAPAPPAGTPTSPLANPTLGPCSGESIAGVDLDRLANSLAAIESQGSGGYTAVGPYTNGGRGLGRYQMMSYLPEVQAEVKQQPGGQAWLNQIESGYDPSAAEIRRYFPEPAQERAYRAEMNQLFKRARGQTDPQTGRAFTGDRLIERVGQMWFGGPGAPIDGGGSDANQVYSIYDYGRQVRENYAAADGAGGANCVPGSGGTGKAGQATGDFANPAQGYPITSNFGPRPQPCAGCSKYHPAIDLGTPVGTPINAADGGTVTYVSSAGGYGKTVVVDHGNGYQTRYSHLSGYNVSVGDQVAKGETIAASGNTGAGTGPHLDFGVYENSGSNYPPPETAINPENFINF